MVKLNNEIPNDSLSRIGGTPLIRAIVDIEDPKLRRNFVRLLIQAHANPNAQDCRGLSSLMHATILGYCDIVNLLLTIDGIDLCLQDEDGNTALMFAASFGYYDIVSSIIHAFNNFHHFLHLGQRNDDGQTALQLAVKNKHENIVQVLSEQSQIFPSIRNEFPDLSDLERSPTPIDDIESDFKYKTAADYCSEGADTCWSIPDCPEMVLEDLTDLNSESPVTIHKISAKFIPKTMPKLEIIQRKDLAKVVRSDKHLSPLGRPPTPARPHLPSLSDKLTSLKPELKAPPYLNVSNKDRRPSNESLTRSSSEPDLCSYEEMVDLLEASVKSEHGGWERYRKKSRQLRGNTAPSSSSELNLPPITMTYSAALKRKQINSKSLDV